MTTVDYLSIVAIIIGICSPLVYMICFRMIKPKIIISEKIAEREDKEENKPIYSIKVVNKTRFALVNIKAELLLMKNKIDGYEFREIYLRKKDVIKIPKFNFTDQQFSYTFKFSTYENIRDYLKDDDTFLLFTISAAHSLTHTTQDFSKKYIIKDICRGIFRAGPFTDIISE